MTRTEGELSRGTRARRRYRRERRRQSGRWRYRPLLRAGLAVGAGLLAAGAVAFGAVLVSMIGAPAARIAPAAVAVAPIAPESTPESMPATPEPPAPAALALAPIPAVLVKPPPPGGGAETLPMIAIIIDDLGLSSERAHHVIALPPPLTLSFLPYGHRVAELAAEAAAAGHEILLHMPMEPLDGSLNPGPHALLTGLSDAELDRRIAWNLDRFSGYVGVNNHMGSRFTRSAHGMQRVMATLQARGLLFVDSVTTPETVGLASARAQGVPAVARDVFLDTAPEPAAIAGQLAGLARTARRHGQAVAIGHPYPETLRVLDAWLPTLAERGLRLVPVSALVPPRVEASAGPPPQRHREAESAAALTGPAGRTPTARPDR